MTNTPNNIAGEEWDKAESLARDFHDIYQQEARRQGDVRHKDNYDNLSENIKDFDRVLARHTLKLIQEAIAGQKLRVLAWLGHYRDSFPPESVSALQGILDEAPSPNTAKES